MTQSLSVKELYSFVDTRRNKYGQCRRTKSCVNISFETPTYIVPNISKSLPSSDETVKGTFYQTMKKISTSQYLDEEHRTPGCSAKLIIVKPAMPIK